MKFLYSLIKADYLQRTRNYSFLIILAVTVYAAYLFVPPNTASYTTLNATGYRSVFNSAWVGYVSGTMTAVMLSLYGFLLVNSGIKKDIETGVGAIVATTPVTNFGYLLTKLLSNFLVFFTIAGITFAVSMVMFLLRSQGFPFILSDFVTPYLVFAVPALFVVSGLAVVAEVFLGTRSILQFIIYFFICGAVMAAINSPGDGVPTALFDPFGLSLVTGSIKAQINSVFHDHVQQVSFGFIFNKRTGFKTFEWGGVNFTIAFLFSRVLWMAFSLLLVYVSSFFFHRFDVKGASIKKRKTAPGVQLISAGPSENKPITLGPLPTVVFDYGIFPFIKTELLLLIRKGPKWFWLFTAGVWVAMLFAPLDIAHTYLLPVIWFLQVTRWSELSTKERANRLHYFTYSSYKPLQRMLPAQIIAGITLAIVLALPIILRYVVGFNMLAVAGIICGAIFIVLLAIGLGIVSGGKKLFEVLFFMLTYAVVQKVPFADYLGVVPHQNYTTYFLIMLLLIFSLGLVSVLARKYEARHM